MGKRLRLRIGGSNIDPVDKIESYIESANIQTKHRNAQETANVDAVAYLKEKYPNSHVEYSKGWKSNYGRRSGGYDTHEVVVKHSNGFAVVMDVRVGGDDETFRLVYRAVRVGEMSDNVEKILNTLERTTLVNI